MAGQPRRVYAPSLEPAEKAPPPRRSGWAAPAFSAVVVLGSLAFLWTAVFGAGAPPVVKAPTTPYKIAAPPTEKAPAEQAALYDVLEASRSPAKARAGADDAPAKAAVATTETKAEPALAPAGAQADGPYVAQIAALQSLAAAQALGPRLAKANPAAYAGVTFDVQRVERDKSVFFRVRAGYFADWAEASLFCKRIAAEKQDCIVVSR